MSSWSVAVLALIEFCVSKNPQALLSVAVPWPSLKWGSKAAPVNAGEKVLVRISGAPSVATAQPRRLHAKNESLGQVPLYLFDRILIEGDDANQCEDGEEVGGDAEWARVSRISARGSNGRLHLFLAQVTLMHWGNCVFEKVERDDSGAVTGIQGRLHLEGDFKKTKKKLNWLADLPDSAEAKASLANPLAAARLR